MDAKFTTEYTDYTEVKIEYLPEADVPQSGTKPTFKNRWQTSLQQAL